MHRIDLLRQQLKASFAQAPAYQFTVDGSADDVLTPEQRAFYEKNGFFVVKNVVNKEEMARWRTRFNEVCRDPAQRPFGMQVMRDISVVKKGIKKDDEYNIHKLQDWQEDQVLFEYLAHPNILKYVRAFCGNDVKVVHSMLINKPPNVGKTTRHPLHQDLMYFPFRPANRIVCSWTAMVPVTRENGGLVVVPGSHTGELVKHAYPNWESEGGVNKSYYGIEEVPKDSKFIYLEMAPGDTVFFHPLLIHGSGENKTQEYRLSISGHFSTCHAHYVDPKGTNTDPLATEIVDYAKKLLKLDEIKYTDIWKIKVKLVSGSEVDGGL